MTATTDFVGTRVFSNLKNSIALIDTTDSTTIGLTMPAPNADNQKYPMDEPVLIRTDDQDMLLKLGEGLTLDVINQIASEGIVTNISFVRTQHSDLSDADAKLDAEINAIVGSAGLKTGIHAHIDARSHIGVQPGLLISPGYTSKRIENAANPVATAMDGVCNRLIDCMGLVETPETSINNAIEYAADFAASLNMIAIYPGALVNLGKGQVTRPLTPHVAAAIVRRDKQAGNAFKAAWNRPLKGILGPSQSIEYIDGDAGSEANQLLQGGVGTVIEKKLLWAPFTTATDPTVKAYRSIKRIRTRRAIEKAMLRPMRKFLSEDMTPHMVTLIYQSLDQFLGDIKATGALIDYDIIWDRKQNPNSLLEKGTIRVKPRFAETPDLTDLQIYTEPQPEAFDVLATAIASALAALGTSSIRVNR